MNPQLLPLPECSKGDVVETALSFFVQGFDNRITAVAGMNNSLAVQGEYQILKVSLRQSSSVIRCCQIGAANTFWINSVFI